MPPKIGVFIITLFLTHLTSTVQGAWPRELFPELQNDNYGHECKECLKYYSPGYCATPTCCKSCEAKAGNYGLTRDQACSGVCELTRTFEIKDLELNHKCRSPMASSNPDCDGATKYLDQSIDLQQREIVRRELSCQEAADQVRQHCSVQVINNVIPVDVFNLSKKIIESPTCDYDDIKSYNLKSTTTNPEEIFSACDRHRNSCQSYCSTYNTIQGKSIPSYTKYETECAPTFATYNDQRNQRINYMNKAVQRLKECSSKTSPQGKATPIEVYNNMNQWIKSIQQFIPQSKQAGLPSQAVDVVASPYTTPNQISEEQYWGPEYQGESEVFNDDMSFAMDPDLDQPLSLRNNKSQHENKGGHSAPPRGGFVGLGGRPQPIPKKISGKGKTPPKDKTLFGKRYSSSGYYSFSSEDEGFRQNTGLGSSTNPDGSKTENEFNPSKYHDQILASYSKGLNSKAQQMAKRRAMGLAPEDPNGFDSRGYEEWHLKNQIHPESISLFMQMRICYDKKYSNDFSVSCEARK